MSNCASIIRILEDHSGRLDKEAIILAEARAGNAELFQGFRLALDPMITFGVKKVPRHGGPDGQGLPWPAFMELARNLAERHLTGDAARRAIELCLGSARQGEWNDWYMRILAKDLRCGVSEKTVNKIVEEINADYVIPIFACQLAHDSANHETKVSGEKLIEVKLDGVRVLTIVHPNGRVDQFSRNGKELINFGHIKSQFESVAGSLTAPMVFDGEVMSSSFQDLMKQVHRKSDVSAGDAVLHLFDAVPLAAFQAGRFDQKQSARSAWLRQWFEENISRLPNVAILDQALIDLDTEEGQNLFRMYNKSAVENGYEGIMIKDPAAIYECKRTTAWLKLKPFIEVSLEVVDVEVGTGKNEGRLGALVCEGQDDGREIRVNVGSGLSDDQRDDIWANRQSVIGRIAEVRADAVTQNQDGTFSLRFPRFKTFRGFEVGEKI